MNRACSSDVGSATGAVSAAAVANSDDEPVIFPSIGSVQGGLQPVIIGRAASAGHQALLPTAEILKNSRFGAFGRPHPPRAEHYYDRDGSAGSA
jgi:hypothetical protein